MGRSLYEGRCKLSYRFDCYNRDPKYSGLHTIKVIALIYYPELVGISALRSYQRPKLLLSCCFVLIHMVQNNSLLCPHTTVGSKMACSCLSGKQPRYCTCHYSTHPIGQNLGTRTHLLVSQGKQGNVTFNVSSHIP